ncbi:hypothetical protein FH972_023507 [Carpinus fangiana]|uniref:Cleft lip and palate transmembrane protein 1 n=1 Tax=Carpinus fangiana TaxID=176857 RepID=A0A5N6KXN0_9ROSI|nr:hypothetical protein FH972_023507 [Carpinus fangiana]
MKQILQSVAIFILVQFAIKQFMSGNGTATGSASGNSTAAVRIPAYADRPDMRSLEGPYNPIPQHIAPIWGPNVTMDLTIFVSPSIVMPSLKTVAESSVVLQEKNVTLDDWSDTRYISTTFPLPKEVQNNGTLFAHFYIAQSGAVLDPTAGHYNPATAYHFVRPLNQYFLKKKVVKTRNLLKDKVEEEVEEVVPEGPQTIASYYHPNFTMSFVPQAGLQFYPKMHPALRDWIQHESTGARDISGQHGWYYPILYVNTFWQLRHHMIELNDTVTELPLNIQLDRLAHWKFSIISTMDFGNRENAKKLNTGEKLPGGSDGSEMEQIKKILLDSNIYLLSTTVIVGLLHTIFEMLAFKSDVSHWRNKKDNVGVSVRTIIANVFMKTTIFLYLLDNSENTSWMILAGEGMGILLEAWKVTTSVNVRIRQTPANETALPWKYLPYTIVMEDKHKLSETEEKTKEYDEIAFKYMFWIAIPLIIAYAGYSLTYDSHKSWYSFILTTLVGSVYAYGFLMMVPALYINYRLQSVAHMPGRAMAYKFLNTFIDDLFAFTVKMPLLHRLATLRDDVVFFVYLYQCWAYKVDKTRVNEFGQGGEDEDVAEKLASEPLKAPAGGQTSEVKAIAEGAKTSGRDSAGGKKRK